MRSPYYGWFVVAALFVMLTVASGLAFYNLSLYMSALVETRGYPVGSVSGAIALFFVASGLAGMVAARLLQHHDPRLTITLGGVIGAVALLLLGRVSELWQLYVVYAVFGVGHAFAALVPATTLVTRWFSTNRSVALSIASTGLSLGGILLTPLSAGLIGRVGLEGATPLLAAVWFLGIVPITALIVRAAPAAPPAVAGVGQAAPTDVLVDGWAYADAVRSRFFVLLTGAWILCMGAQVGGISHLYNLAATRVDAGTGAAAVSFMATASIIGRFVGGWLITRMDTRLFALACLASQAVATLLFAHAELRSTLLAAAVLFGATVGNLLMLQPLLIAEAFGVRDYGRIYSLGQLLSTLGVASGPLVIGLLYDAAGGYTGAFMVAAAASSIAFVAVLAGGAMPSTTGPGTRGAASANGTTA
ncbi:MAG: MFS transporter [Pseudomonadales bacterium]|jgi:MFS family permease|nr:MFS transporter [Pseudomonadales bacterium]